MKTLAHSFGGFPMRLVPALALSFGLLVGGPAVSAAETSPTAAVCVIVPTANHTVQGVLHFVDGADGLHITGEVSGLTAGAEQAMHIHQFGDLTAADGTSAGGHYNPGGHHHGGPDADERHAGDLGNLTANAEGKASIDMTVPGLSVLGAGDPVLGRSIVIHAGVDDLTSQPSGNAGPRAAVGVIGVAKASDE
jgi:superoxide dismutase, Cu-Zn family